MSPFYSAKGDEGVTGLPGQRRVAKSDLQIETLGFLDEATSMLGMARAHSRLDSTREILLHVQRDMYRLMSSVAAAPGESKRFTDIGAEDVTWLEEHIRQFENSIKMPREFIVPGDTIPAAVIDLARTVVRRAERRVVELFQKGVIQNPQLLRYLNRLSSLCFVLELCENQAAGMEQPTSARIKFIDRHDP